MSVNQISMHIMILLPHSTLLNPSNPFPQALSSLHHPTLIILKNTPESGWGGGQIDPQNRISLIAHLKTPK